MSNLIYKNKFQRNRKAIYEESALICRLDKHELPMHF